MRSTGFTWMRIFPIDTKGVLNSVVNRQPTKKSPSPLLKNCKSDTLHSQQTQSAPTGQPLQYVFVCVHTTYINKVIPPRTHQSDGRENEQQRHVMEDQHPVLAEESLHCLKRVAAV